MCQWASTAHNVVCVRANSVQVTAAELSCQLACMVVDTFSCRLTHAHLLSYIYLCIVTFAYKSALCTFAKSQTSQRYIKHSVKLVGSYAEIRTNSCPIVMVTIACRNQMTIDDAANIFQYYTYTKLQHF